MWLINHLFKKSTAFVIALVLLSGGAWASVQSVELYIGERKTLPLEVSNPFAADETLLAVESASPDRVVITGLRGGDTQLYFWKEGVLDYVAVTILVPEQIKPVSHGPRFRAYRPYFNYIFQNNAGFDRDSFYTVPNYFHTLVNEIPLERGKQVRPFVSVSHQADNSWAIPNAALSYTDPSKKLVFGQSSTSLTRLFGGVFSGASFLGPELEFRLANDRRGFQHELHFFGGVKEPEDLRDTEFEDEKFGTNYSMVRYRPASITPDLLNVSVFSYEHASDDVYHPAGIAEGSMHLTPAFSIGAGTLRGEGGMAAVLTPTFEGEDFLFSGRYTYVNHGLQGFGDTLFENDEHQSQLLVQNQNERFVWDASLTHDLSLSKGSSSEPSSDTLRSGLGVRRALSSHKYYGVNYSIGRSHTEGEESTFSNGLAAYFNYSLTPHAFMSHTLGYSRSDFGTETQQISSDHSWRVENSDFRNVVTVTGLMSLGDVESKTLGLINSAQLNLGSHSIQAAASYIKPDFETGSHLFTFVPSFYYHLSSLQYLILNGSMVYAVVENAESSLNGVIGVQYQRYFGPGVEPDPLWRKLFQGERHTQVKGLVFLDQNSNASFDKGEVPLQGVEVGLDGKKKTKSGADGYFVFTKVAAGPHVLSVQAETVAVHETVAPILQQTFATTDREPPLLAIPIMPLRASVRVRLVMDVDGNGRGDPSDDTVSVPKVICIPSSGEQRTVRTQGGEVVISGVERGELRLSLDPLDVPENVELMGPMEYVLSIEEYTEYDVVFLFRPIRAIRGQVILNREGKIPAYLDIHVGERKSHVDANGYYWIKDLLPGTWPLEIRGLPATYCADSVPTEITVPEGPFLREWNVLLKADCQAMP